METRTYGSAREFLAALPDCMPDGMPECLILDLQMPEMNGLELQRHLNREGIAIPTIVITAHRESDMRELCEAAGADTYLHKPLQDTILLAAIDQARRRPSTPGGKNHRDAG